MKNKFLLVIMLILSIVPLNPIHNNIYAQPTNYIVGPNDILLIYVEGHPELSHSKTVNSSGYISYTPIGDILVIGLSLKEIENLLAEKLSSYISEPKVTVVLSAFRMRKVSVIGQVVNPGSFDYIEGYRITDYVNLAGGPTNSADLRHVRITRTGTEGSKVFKINLNKVLKRGQKELDIPMQPGDIVVIPRTLLYRLRDLTPFGGLIIGIVTAYLLYAR